MILIETPITASQVLRAFDHDAPFLFLGSAFITVGIVSVGFCALRRRFDPLLVWMAIFAGLYGMRLWQEARILDIAPQPSWFLDRLRSSVDYVIPIPAFFFFRAAGFLNRGGRAIVVGTSILFLSMFAATFLIGPLYWIHIINNYLVIAVLVLLVVRSIGEKSRDRDFEVVRAGMLFFAAFALWENLGGRKLLPYYLEPYGFAGLLACLGYVAARRTLQRDVKLGEIQSELELARRTQLSILPGAFPASNSFRVAARYVPMTSVAGDLYDFLVASDSEAGLLIADVSGHGMPAALIASMVKMAAISQRARAAHPAQLLTGMNSALCGNTQGQFVTAAYVHLDADAHQLRYAAAGHPAMLMLRKNVVTEIAENGLLLAAVDLETYTERSLPLEPGDRLLLYTDGLVEARNAQGELFGEEALAAAFRATADLSADQTADRLIAQAQRWAKSQDDDLTVLVCDYLGAQ